MTPERPVYSAQHDGLRKAKQLERGAALAGGGLDVLEKERDGCRVARIPP